MFASAFALLAAMTMPMRSRASLMSRLDLTDRARRVELFAPETPARSQAKRLIRPAW